MSIGIYFESNFAIFYTDHDKKSINFIYDYALWRAYKENRNVIVYCTTPEKEEEWKKIISHYDLEALTICYEACEGFGYFENMLDNYIDSIHLQNIVIIDGAYDLFYGIQMLPFEPAERLIKRYNDIYSIKDEEKRRKRIKEHAELNSRSKDELLDIMTECSENMIFLIAEAEGKSVNKETLEQLYPGLINYGDAVLEIFQNKDYTDVIPIVQRGLHKWENIKEIKADRKLAEDLYTAFGPKDIKHPHL